MLNFSIKDLWDPVFLIPQVKVITDRFRENLMGDSDPVPPKEVVVIGEGNE